MFKIPARYLLAAGLACPWWPALAGASPPRDMIELRSGALTLEGAPLGRTSDSLEILGRDGRIWDLKTDRVERVRKLPIEFRSTSAAEIKAALEREFGSQLEVRGTGHFVVACPRGQSSRWVQRFEDLYRSFRSYFAVRGLEPSQPQFPLVAIVWPKQSDFLGYAREHKEPAGLTTLGYYSLRSNRITLFDTTGMAGGDWSRNASVIIHEATHQSAFNCGLHNRFAPPPRWLAEGVGMLFEAPGVWDSLRHPALADRVNRGRLAQFRTCQARGRKGQSWQELLGSDKLFDRDPGAAYAESWAFAFFLMETAPQQFCSYLKRTAARPDFTPISAADRLADFRAVFGSDFSMLEARFVRFMGDIRLRAKDGRQASAAVPGDSATAAGAGRGSSIPNSRIAPMARVTAPKKNENS